MIKIRKLTVTIMTFRTLPKGISAVSLFAFCCLLAGPARAEIPPEFESLSNIRATAEKFALAQLKNPGFSNITAQAAALDSRLQLKHCNIPLEAFSSGAGSSILRTTVGVRCQGEKPWTLYVPVSIDGQAEVVVSSRPLNIGELLQGSDMRLQNMAISKLPSKYSSEINAIAGMEITRAINAGAVMTSNYLKVRHLVKQGQEVTIQANGSGVQVQMGGKAMKSGSYGDLIPVRNANSGLTVEATVVSAKTVVVKL
jgi:flagella basal body P-ring formation protein FlgA